GLFKLRFIRRGRCNPVVGERAIARVQRYRNTAIRSSAPDGLEYFRRGRPVAIVGKQQRVRRANITSPLKGQPPHPPALHRSRRGSGRGFRLTAPAFDLLLW